MTTIDPQSAIETMWKLAPEYAQAKAHRIYLEEYSRVLKARLMKGYPDLSVSAQEREAFADPKYEDHLKGLQASIEVEEKLRWRLTSAQTAVEVWRSMESSSRMIDKATR